MIEIAVCDDDVDDLNHVVSILHEIFSIQNIRYNIETFLSVNKMLDINKKIDIGVLDTAMAELNGIKAGRKLKEKFPNVKLIYITNYEEYCMQRKSYSFFICPLFIDFLKVFQSVHNSRMFCVIMFYVILMTLFCLHQCI